MTQVALAAAVRVDRGTVIKWEKDREHPNEENRIGLAAVLGIEVPEPDRSASSRAPAMELEELRQRVRRLEEAILGSAEPRGQRPAAQGRR
ncbi:MAG: helix-turn-helix domain-containing protein [Thermoanaerobaculia bacterium]|nr:helix-turn-helix domain-containing protein [Thermoanaerobaculia bacterium]